ncbi:16S rRNA methyltransferase [Ignicoccus pacificus DSM 13166]|uniref:16S rRNA methyltransferase n=1 Tax=Ignicoccus pacificus DSM 13166 TaxID=940294 RepID=A0A977PJL2_9CREN|nr:16S rRNA methyltransferase [Ignicoccus pacificus DSM 13166]
MLGWTRAELARLGVRPSKKLGQNFTVNPKIIEYFLSQVPPSSLVLEIGAGLGVLTEALSSRASKVIALEKDKRLCEYLAKRFKGNEKVLIVCGDALEYPLEAEILVGSLPYSISGPFLGRVFTEGKWKKAVFLLQKEVAERLVTEPGTKEYGRLSVMAQLCCDVELGPKWGPKSFWPPPEVESQHVVLKRKRSLPKEFSQFLACVFSQRNKKAKKVLPRCGSSWEGEERVRELTPQHLWEAFERSRTLKGV